MPDAGVTGDEMPVLQPDAFPFTRTLALMVLSIAAMILMTRKYRKLAPVGGNQRDPVW